MKSTLDCLECIAKQALRAARIASDDEVVQRQILQEAMAAIPGMDTAKSPAVLSLVVYEQTAALSGKPDPYREAKLFQNELALAIEDELRERVRVSSDPLDTALHIAAAGNVVDLGTLHAHEIDIHSALEQVLRDRFSIDHSQAFRASLENCEDLLYLLDNAGEIVFDKILIEELQKHTKVTAVVKAGPIINDALLEDAEQVGLTQVCEVIDNGGAFVGSPLDLVPERFLARMRSADLILGKGQGNYETIDDFDGDVFLILRAKCEVIARHMGVKFGQVALISTRLRNALAAQA
jgi:uncharacterized protein with ATP-grasp and redox domains